MKRHDKKILREETLQFYKAFSHSLYKRWCYQYTTNEVRHEILKILINHIMKKTTQALHGRIKRKKVNPRGTQRPLSVSEPVEDIDFLFEPEDESFVERL